MWGSIYYLFLGLNINTDGHRFRVDCQLGALGDNEEQKLLSAANTKDLPTISTFAVVETVLGSNAAAVKLSEMY